MTIYFGSGPFVWHRTLGEKAVLKNLGRGTSRQRLPMSWRREDPGDDGLCDQVGMEHVLAEEAEGSIFR